MASCNYKIKLRKKKKSIGKIIVTKPFTKYSIGSFHFSVKSGVDNILVKEAILEVVQKVKEDEELLYEQLVDITATDNLMSKKWLHRRKIYSYL